MDESTLPEGVTPASSRQGILEEGVPPGRGKGLRAKKRTGISFTRGEGRKGKGRGKAPLLPGMSPETPREPEPEPEPESESESETSPEPESEPEPTKSRALGDFTPHYTPSKPPPMGDLDERLIPPPREKASWLSQQVFMKEKYGPDGRNDGEKRDSAGKRKRKRTRTRKPSSKRKRTGKR